MHYSPPIFSPFSNISAAQSTRHGGVSLPPYASLNLGKSTNDRPEDVLENRKRFFGSLGFGVEQIAISGQTHSARTRIVTKPDFEVGYDAMVTNVKGICIAVTVADCTPILVYDAQNQVVAAIHAGWRGTVAGIVHETLAVMKSQYNTQATSCFAYVGTCIGEDSFEVGAEVAERFDEVFVLPAEAEGKFLVNLKAANSAQLLAFGIPSSQVEVSPHCTLRQHHDYFSYRADAGLTGRMMAAIGLK